MEYAPNGNLYELITKEKNGFSEYKAFEYFIQVVNAVYYLHNNNIIPNVMNNNMKLQENKNMEMPQMPFMNIPQNQNCPSRTQKRNQKNPRVPQ